MGRPPKGNPLQGQVGKWHAVVVYIPRATSHDQAPCPPSHDSSPVMPRPPAFLVARFCVPRPVPLDPLSSTCFHVCPRRHKALPCTALARPHLHGRHFFPPPLPSDLPSGITCFWPEVYPSESPFPHGNSLHFCLKKFCFRFALRRHLPGSPRWLSSGTDPASTLPCASRPPAPPRDLWSVHVHSDASRCASHSRHLCVWSLQFGKFHAFLFF